MKKLLFVLGILSLFILAACAQQQPEDLVGGGTPVVAETPVPGSEGIEEAVAAEEPSAEEPGPAQETAAESSIKEIEVTAKKWEFTPNPIEVSKGDRVRLKITSIDVAHGFALPDFGVSQRLEPGKTEIVEFTADKEGSFSFFCNVFCGSGHSTMRGTLIVK